MNRYEEIETYVRTVEAGSFTAAAAQLGVAKSVVSRRITELEERLGVQLMVRTTRRLSLTDEGQGLYEQSVRLLADWEEVEASVGQQQTAQNGSIRLSVPLSYGLAHIGPSVLKFQETHPQVSVDIDFTDRKVDLISEGFDLVVRIGDLSDSSMIARKLTCITTTAVASPEYLRQHGVPETPEALRAHRELRFGWRARKGWTFTAPDGSTGEVEMQSSMRANNGDFLCAAAINNHGVAILPEFIVKSSVQRGDLIEILENYTWGDLNVYALYPSNRHLPGRVRALIDHLVTCCEQQ